MQKILKTNKTKKEKIAAQTKKEKNTAWPGPRERATLSAWPRAGGSLARQ